MKYVVALLLALAAVSAPGPVVVRHAEAAPAAAPEIASLSRTSDRKDGGAEVVVEGSNFVGSVELFLGDAAVAEPTVESPMRIRFRVPPQRSYGGRLLTVRTGAGVAQRQFDIRPVPLAEIANGQITTVAGGGIAYRGDGQAATSAAVTLQPQSIAVDAAGNVYATEFVHSQLRCVDAATGRIVTIAGTGAREFSGDGGQAIVAGFDSITSVVVDAAGNLFVLDYYNYRVRRIDAATGVVQIVAGNGDPDYAGDGGLATETGMTPSALAVGADGTLFVYDFSGRILRVDAGTRVVTTVADVGGPATGFEEVTGLAVDSHGNLYLASAFQIRRVAAATGVVDTIAGTGVSGFGGDGGPALEASLRSVTGIAFDRGDNLFVADWGNGRVRRIDAATGIITTYAGSGSLESSGDGGPATEAGCPYPSGVALAPAGDLLISSVVEGRIRRVSAASGIVTTYAGGARSLLGSGAVWPASEGGLATSISLYAIGLAADPDGFLVASSKIFRVDAADGIISFVAGTYAPSPDQMHAQGLARDPAGNVLVADPSGSRVWRVDATSGAVSVVAGNGTVGYGGDLGPATAATLSYPVAVASDRAGNVFIADTGNHRIRRVDAATGIITTVVGTGVNGFGGDTRRAVRARLSSPLGVAVDAAGTLYIADGGNDRIRRVRKGIITTFAGSTAGFGGDGGPAKRALLDSPVGLALDAAGNLFVADFGNHRVRRIDAASRIISTVAGDGVRRLAGDGGAATAASLYNPFAVAVDEAGNLLIADTGNLAVRSVKGAAAP